MSLVTARCRKCKYFSKANGHHYSYAACNYILHEGHSRGCPAGDECDKYDEGTPLRLPFKDEGFSTAPQKKVGIVWHTNKVV